MEYIKGEIKKCVNNQKIYGKGKHLSISYQISQEELAWTRTSILKSSKSIGEIVKKNKLYSPAQFGFRNKLSTILAINTISQKIPAAFESNPTLVA